MIIKALEKLNKVQQYFAIGLGIPLWVLILYILGKGLGAPFAIGWIVIFVGFLVRFRALGRRFLTVIQHTSKYR